MLFARKLKGLQIIRIKLLTAKHGGLNILAEGYSEELFEKLYKCEAKSFWFQSRNRLIIKNIKKYFREINHFLEVGCGTGFVLKAVKEKFPECECIGNDLFEEGISYAKKRVPKAEFLQGNVLEMEFNHLFDVIGLFDVLEHIEKDEEVLKKCSALLGKSGGIIVSVPQHMSLWSGTDERACHVRRYSQKELKDKLLKSGFEVVYMSGFVSLLFPLMWISRRFGSNEKGEEIDINSFINCIFSWIMRVEELLLKLGITFSFGGSILAVAFKRKD